MMLYANGCSMTAGEELGGDVFDSRGYKISDVSTEYRLENAYPKKLADLLNMDCFNDACGGSSNDRITRTTIDWTSNYLQTNKAEELFVVIGWSAPNRIEFRIDDRWIDILPQWVPPEEPMKTITNFYDDNIYDEIYDDTRTVINILSLQSWLKTNKIPYLFTSALHVDYTKMCVYVKTMIDMIELNRYFHMLDSKYHMYRMCNNYPKGPREHPLEEGHAAWARILHQHITQNKWILKHDNS